MAAIGLGSNLGDRRGHIEFALQALGGLSGTRIVSRSPLVETAPVGLIVQPAFLNAADRVETTLPPRDLLGRLLGIEKARGRDRDKEQRWGPRTLDLDLLLFGSSSIHE